MPELKVQTKAIIKKLNEILIFLAVILLLTILFLNIKFLISPIMSLKYLNDRLMKSIEDNNISEAKFAIDHGADVNYIDKNKISVLTYAVISGNAQIVEYLLQKKLM